MSDQVATPTRPSPVPWGIVITLLSFLIGGIASYYTMMLSRPTTAEVEIKIDRAVDARLGPLVEKVNNMNELLKEVRDDVRAEHEQRRR